MKTIPSCAMLLLAGVLVLAGCGGGQKMEPVPVGEMEQYRDPGIGFSIDHPKGWISAAEVGRVRFFNAQDVDKKFLEPTGAYPIGVTITVDVTAATDPAAAVQARRKDLEQGGRQLGKEEPVTVGGVKGIKLPYKENYGSGNLISGYHILLTTDSAWYDIGAAGFGPMFDAYTAVFNASLASFTFPKPKEKGADETLPSTTFSPFEAGMIALQYPDNFNPVNAPKGKFEQVIELRGVRLDCSIRLDVFGAKGLTVEKVFDQNKAAYKGRTPQKATVGGESALMVNYPTRADVDSRAYFAVKNDKVVRITMNWYKPQTAQYLEAYEKVVSSIKFK
jgi:hypothetical protein